MTTMPDRIRSAYTEEMAAARDTADDNERWAHLERAHIISQPYPWRTPATMPRCSHWRCANTTGVKRSDGSCGSSSPHPAR